MVTLLENTFQEIWLVDFEFGASPGERQTPVCLVALELKSGRTLRLWEDELRTMKYPPYGIGKDAVFIAYFASAEFGCHLSLGWPLPVNVIDLFAEFRNVTNGLPLPSGRSLLGALTYFGINGMASTEKDSMRELALRGGPWAEEEKQDLLEYCESDVIALKKLIRAMPSTIDIPHALLRGRYMKAVAQMEYNGVPIDAGMLSRLKNKWDEIKDVLIEKVDQDYGVFDGRTFKYDKFVNYLIRNNIPWPYLPSGSVDLRDETFKEMSYSYPEIYPLRLLRTTLSQLRLSELTVGNDGYNRCLLSPYQAKTGRNQPSNARFIFGPSKWIRGLIKPKKGNAIAYIDWEQQEFGIAGALSRDPNMKEAYSSGDPYLTFAKQAKAVPADATKKSHGKERDLFKTCALGVQYGMGEKALSLRIKEPPIVARNLLHIHRATYPKFWRWSDSVVDHIMTKRFIPTVYGWTLHLASDNANPRSFRNFPMQANGAEMLRLACWYLVESGIRLCCPIHDALLIEGPVDEIEVLVQKAQSLMAKASEKVLNGFVLRSEVEIVKYPDRYMDNGGEEMWDRILGILDRLEKGGL